MSRLLAFLVVFALAWPAGPVQAEPMAKIRLFGYDRNARQLVLLSDRPLSPYGFHLSSPERWVVDLPNARYIGGTTALSAIPGTPVRGVRIGHFKPGTVRLVFDLNSRASFSFGASHRGFTHQLAFDVHGTASQPVPKPAAAQPSAPKPAASKPTPSPPEAESAEGGLSLKKSGSGWLMTLGSEKDAIRYRSVPSGRGDKIILELSSGHLDLPKDSLYVDSGLIARVRVTEQGGRQRITIELDKPVAADLRLGNGNRTLMVAMSRPGTSPRAVAPKRETERRITLDPGHGGEDPGARGHGGAQEKDLTLQMAMRLQRLMEDAGMEVQMTRTKDMQIHLRHRVDLGDDFESDVFISIHANSISNPRISGIETYYFTPQSLKLARAVHRHLVAKLGRPDRGVRRNNFVVVKYNKMPACLVEIGYLSNPTEEKLLTSPAYQQKAAEAILAGVQEYFRALNYRQ